MSTFSKADAALAAQIARRGFGKLVRVVHKTTVLHADWELDSEAWIVELEGKGLVALDTTEGWLRLWPKDVAVSKLAETEASAAGLRRALELWPV